MQTTITKTGDQGTVMISGRFDFQTHKDFRAMTDELFSSKDTSRVVIDLHKCEYLDSSALGMLLLAKQKCEAAGKKLSLSAKRNSTARQVLEVANFNKLFEFTEA